MVSNAPASAAIEAPPGLAPGTRLEMTVSTSRGVEKHVSQVEAVDGPRIEVQVPIHHRQLRPLQLGAKVTASYTIHTRTEQFAAEVVGHSGDGALVYLENCGRLGPGERRTAFRLEVAIVPQSVRRLVPGDEGPEWVPDRARYAIADLSEGGARLQTKGDLASGDTVELLLDLADQGQLAAKLNVIASDEREGYSLRQLHCRFVELSNTDRNRVARFLLRRQIQLRRDGRL